ncbi:DNA-binding transcriptional regulator, LysR family [Cohaesibacter marisflavi]|uniref:DNA-binding transcriptional regulator, LysR family n=1 Tax=Cohaesibacter marisflavi TaxID=655353 RepID=A0A1I5EZF3_9HYPH|nr:LysR family transcriptional regulator [Cohaesibacter marisflavi]SFO16769.1 DNA-binding transcriptional regulator, LysR family [Cohaesibacter marisflavi]
MITFKQLEAIYWIAELGSFAAAADKLNTTQSAVSKRVQDFELLFNVAIFDRSKRSARLTEKGAEALDYARGLLEGRDTFIERISSQDVLIRQFRLGVTELTAMTWLPNLVKSIKADYSGINIEPVVESSSALFDRLMEDTIDMIVIPDVFNDSRCVSEPLGLVENAWMCSPDLDDSDTPLSLSDLANFTMLVQGNKSGTGLVYGRWLSSQGITPSKTINCESLLAQIGFTMSGLGVSYLPIAAVRSLIQAGSLRRLVMQSQMPHVRYALLYRHDRLSQFKLRVVELAQAHCDFTVSPIYGATI